MTISRAKRTFVLGPCLAAALLAATPVFAQTGDNVGGGRDASFLPPSDAAATSAPMAITPVAPATNPAATSVVTPATSSVAPVAPNATPTPAAAAPLPARPVDLGKPVEAGMLDDIHPESVGLMTQSDGGLGAAMWKGTLRAVPEHVLPAMNLPTSSPVLNDLARRFLLTTAGMPEGAADAGRSLTAMRVEKLTMLGDASDAWKLAMLAKPDQTDDITLRLAAESALLGDAKDDVCAKLPDIMKTHGSPEWQKSLLVCQLRAKDTKAAQLTFDLLRTQNVQDPALMELVEKNILGTSKQLPRRLTPLKPLTLALLRMVDAPLPGEVYAHADAALIPELLHATAREDNTRLALAERAAERALITPADLAAVYANTTFTPDAVTSPFASTESGARMHALLYQAALKETSPQKRADIALRFLANASAALLNGSGAKILADMLGAQKPGEDMYNASVGITRIYLLAGKSDAALEWLKLAQHGAIGTPAIAADLQNLWPLLVLGGLESDKDYTANFSKWLDGMLKTGDAKTDMHAQRDQVASLLLLLDADGFAVTDESWAKVIDAPSFEKHQVPDVLLQQRLQAAGVANRRGEAVLLALALSGNDFDLDVTVETIRALRRAGLTADAALLAREAALTILMPAPAKP